MFILLGILVIAISTLLILIVLIQNPKGGVLSSTFGSMGNQILGANRSTDVVEKITWGLAGGLMVLSIASIFLLPSGSELKSGSSASQQQSAVEEAIKNNKSTALPSVPTPTPPQSVPTTPAASTGETPQKK